MSPEAEQTRREFLAEVVRGKPDDTFARYGLAMELASSEPAVAWTHFSYLLERHPEYAATYYQAGDDRADLVDNGEHDRGGKQRLGPKSRQAVTGLQREYNSDGGAGQSHQRQ